VPSIRHRQRPTQHIWPHRSRQKDLYLLLNPQYLEGTHKLQTLDLYQKEMLNMKVLVDSQHLACLFNKDEAIWRFYEERRLARDHRRPLPDMVADVLDQIDWLIAEREIESTYVVAIAKTH
jgi:hypothetical protein